MPLKDWPPKDDAWPLKAPPRSSHEEVANDQQSQAPGFEQRAATLDMAERRPEQLWSQVTDAQAGIETFTRELAALRIDLEQIRGVAGQLGDDYARLRDASREAREGSAATVEVVQEIERRLDEFVQKTERMEKDGSALAATITSYVERFALEKQQFEAFEQRMETLMERERQLSYLPERLEEFSRTFEALTNQADELRRKQASLEPLQGRLQALEATASNMDDTLTALLARHAEQLDDMQQMSATSKADLQYLSDHQQDLALLRSRLEELLTLTGAVEQKMRRNF